MQRRETPAILINQQVPLCKNGVTPTGYSKELQVGLLGTVHTSSTDLLFDLVQVTQPFGFLVSPSENYRE